MFIESRHKLVSTQDQHGNSSDTNNYRGITISPIVSKLFEHVLKLVFFEHLQTSEQQYGFKKNSSTVPALHCLKETESLCQPQQSHILRFS